MKKEVILASASPRRKELLGIITDDFSVEVSDVDEIAPSGIDAVALPEYFAKLKAEDIAKKFDSAIVIGADTAVFLNERMIGKPKNRDDAFKMLSELSGNVHFVITGCCVCCGEKQISFSEKTEVEFYPLSSQEIDAYLDTGEYADKAGSYGIQGKGSTLVKKINGDYFNVVGLPIAKLNQKLKEILKEG